VYLDASKVYFSTGGKGNFTFTIMKNGATEKDVNPMDPVDEPDDTSPTTTADLDAETNRPRLTGPGARASRATAAPKMDMATIGRARR
jgi:hypothetical protein